MISLLVNLIFNIFYSAKARWSWDKSFFGEIRNQIFASLFYYDATEQSIKKVPCSPTHHIQHYMIINLKYWSLVLSLANLYKIIYFFRTEPVCWGFGNMYCFGISLVWISLKSDLCDVGCVCVVGRMCHISFFLCLFIHISECAVSCNQLAFNSLQQMMKIKLLQYLKYVLNQSFFLPPTKLKIDLFLSFHFPPKKIQS